VLAIGQVNDSIKFVEVMDDIRVRRTGPARTTCWPTRATARGRSPPSRQDRPCEGRPACSGGSHMSTGFRSPRDGEQPRRRLGGVHVPGHILTPSQCGLREERVKVVSPSGSERDDTLPLPRPGFGSVGRAAAGRGFRRSPLGPGPQPPRATFNILFVCTGNICRSPMAERLCAAELRMRLGSAASNFALASAGSHAVVGESMHRHAAQALAELGVDEGQFVAQQLKGGAVALADLVLCARREHRSAVLIENPRALRRTFTLREFGRATAGLGPDELDGQDARTAMGSLVGLAASRRSWTANIQPVDDDIPDPFGMRIQAFRDCAETIRACLSGPISLVAAAVNNLRPPA